MKTSQKLKTVSVVAAVCASSVGIVPDASADALPAAAGRAVVSSAAPCLSVNGETIKNTCTYDVLWVMDLAAYRGGGLWYGGFVTVYSNAANKLVGCNLTSGLWGSVYEETGYIYATGTGTRTISFENDLIEVPNDNSYLYVSCWIPQNGKVYSAKW